MTENNREFPVVNEAGVPSTAGSPGKFSDGVWQAEILPATQPGGMRGSRFAYAPGGRSNWHIHTGEQALIVVSGRGLIQWEGLDEPRELKPGDWIHVQPGVPHWHGAADDSVFVHLAVTATGDTDWLTGPPANESPAHESPAHESPAHESPAHGSR